MNIAVLTPADLDAASRLHTECFPDPWPPEGFSALITTGAFGFIACDGGELKGLILARCAGDECEVLTFAVLPGFRRGGIGMALLSCLLCSLDLGHTRAVYLEVADANIEAATLYRKAGFQTVGRRSGYYTAGNQVQDAIIMRRTMQE